jgi:hypothetical protein
MKEQLNRLALRDNLLLSFSSSATLRGFPSEANALFKNSG